MYGRLPRELTARKNAWYERTEAISRLCIVSCSGSFLEHPLQEYFLLNRH